MAGFNYRKLYEKETGVAVPDSFEVHHIDFDRTNNTIDNLVALPKKLHRQYHYYYPGKDRTFPRELSRTFRSPNSSRTIITVYQRYLAIYATCCQWVDYREHLRGLIGNTHNLSYSSVNV